MSGTIMSSPGAWVSRSKAIHNVEQLLTITWPKTIVRFRRAFDYRGDVFHLKWLIEAEARIARAIAKAKGA